MLLASELALLAIDPDSGRHALGIRDSLNACMAGLLIAELTLDEDVERGAKQATVVPVDGAAPDSPVLAAALAVVAERGPKVKAILSSMSRGLDQRIGTGTWDSIMALLVDDGVLAPDEGGLRERHRVLDTAARDEILGRLQAAAAGDDELEPRTALVLSMTGPAQLLEVVAPQRSTRKHARKRIDHALDATALEPIGEVVRSVLAEAAAVVGAVAATTAVTAASSC